MHYGTIVGYHSLFNAIQPDGMHRATHCVSQLQRAGYDLVGDATFISVIDYLVSVSLCTATMLIRAHLINPEVSGAPLFSPLIICIMSLFCERSSPAVILPSSSSCGKGNQCPLIWPLGSGVAWCVRNRGQETYGCVLWDLLMVLPFSEPMKWHVEVEGGSYFLLSVYIPHLLSHHHDPAKIQYRVLLRGSTLHQEVCRDETMTMNFLVSL